MNFNDALDILSRSIKGLQEKAYDGIIVKRLTQSNTLDDNRSSHQRHIAITGEQMDIFPYLRADGYFNPDYSAKDDGLKKFFVEQVPFRLYKTNIESLSDSEYVFNYNSDNYIRVMVSIVRSRREHDTDQIQVSLTTLDDSSFIEFRKLLHKDDFIVILKHYKKLEYDCFGIKAYSDEAEALSVLNNHFFKQTSESTIVKTDELITIRTDNNDATVYTEESLSQILKKMYDNAAEDMKVVAIHSFGIKYGKVIDQKFSISNIVKGSGLPESYDREVGKGIRLYKSFVSSSFGISLLSERTNHESSFANKRVNGADNILIYGVPGAGKSYYIKSHYDTTRQERVVFHPDYSYSDFVGQILPRVENGQLQYVYTPGPFTKILKDAWLDPGNMYYLVIEELNRGNAPAIFGELFQLLDRKKTDAYPSEEVGESVYGITSFDIAQEIYGDKYRKVVIPSNLTILATMNTSDQNVFTLDTAFQRRWTMKYINNCISSAPHAKAIIEGSKISWEAFAKVVNEIIIESNPSMGSSEDKRLGAFFVTERELKKDRFPEKVIKYLWDDVFRIDRETLFAQNATSLEFIIEHYSNDLNDALSSILRAEIYNKMLSETTNESVSSNEESL